MNATEEARVLANRGLWRTWMGIGGWLIGVLVGLSALRDARTGAPGSFGGFPYSRIELGLALDIGGAAFVVGGVELRRGARRLRAETRNANGDPDRPRTAVARWVGGILAATGAAAVVTGFLARELATCVSTGPAPCAVPAGMLALPTTIAALGSVAVTVGAAVLLTAAAVDRRSAERGAPGSRRESP